MKGPYVRLPTAYPLQTSARQMTPPQQSSSWVQTPASSYLSGKQQEPPLELASHAAARPAKQHSSPPATVEHESAVRMHSARAEGKRRKPLKMLLATPTATKIEFFRAASKRKKRKRQSRVAKQVSARRTGKHWACAVYMGSRYQHASFGFTRIFVLESNRGSGKLFQNNPITRRWGFHSSRRGHRMGV